MSGTPPNPISHTFGFCFDGNLYLFGGSQEAKSKRKNDRLSKMYTDSITSEQNILFRVMDMKKKHWSVLKTEYEMPTRDDFAACCDPVEGKLFVFGGYKNGIKSNDLVGIDVRS